MYPKVKILSKNEFKTYENELMELFKENYFKNRRNVILG